MEASFLYHYLSFSVKTELILDIWEKGCFCRLCFMSRIWQITENILSFSPLWSEIKSVINMLKRANESQAARSSSFKDFYGL